MNYSDGIFTISNEGAIPVLLNSTNSSLCNMECQEQKKLLGGMVEGTCSRQINMILSDDEVLLRLTDGYHVHYIPLK